VPDDIASGSTRAAAATALLAAYQSAREQLGSGAGHGPLARVEAYDARGERRTTRALRRPTQWALNGRTAQRLTLLERTLHRDAASGAQFPADLQTNIDHVRASLPPVPARTLLALAIIAVSFAALGLTSIVRALDSPRGTLNSSIDRANHLVSDLAARVLTLDITQLPDALGEIGRTHTRTLAFVVVLLAISIYLVLRPFVPVLRLRRVLLEQTGAFALEERALGERPRDRPVELLVLALPWLLPLYVGLYMVGDAIVDESARWGQWVGGLLIIGGAGARFAYLARSWRRREQALGRAAPVAPIAGPESMVTAGEFKPSAPSTG
jgi:hypothetical protein